MSSLTRVSHYFTQLYNKLMPTPCQLCGQAQLEAVCAACQADLPVLTQACPRCAIPLPSSQICGNCLHDPPYQHKTLSAFIYLEPVDRLIIDFKFHRQLHLTSFFAAAIMKKTDPTALPDMLLPIPLHPRRLRTRGYNQALEIAKVLSAALAIPVRPHYLSRVIDTLPQSTLPLKERKKNIQRAFQCRHTPLPAHIALIDDVITTGRTVNEAAKTLCHAGCQTIEVWTIARAIGHD